MIISVMEKGEFLRDCGMAVGDRGRPSVGSIEQRVGLV
jgi:hypothetical protein